MELMIGKRFSVELSAEETVKVMELIDSFDEYEEYKPKTAYFKGDGAAS